MRGWIGSCGAAAAEPNQPWLLPGSAFPPGPGTILGILLPQSSGSCCPNPWGSLLQPLCCARREGPPSKAPREHPGAPLERADLWDGKLGRFPALPSQLPALPAPVRARHDHRERLSHGAPAHFLHPARKPGALLKSGGGRGFVEPQRLRIGAGHGLGVLAKGWEFVFPNLCHQRPPPLQEESQFHPLEKSRDAPGALDGFFSSTS